MDPLIPLRMAERLFVAFSVVVQEIESQTDYPCDSLHLVLGDYESKRSNYLGSKGWPSQTVKDITTEEVVDLHKWLEQRAEKTSEASKHLDLWEKEINS